MLDHFYTFDPFKQRTYFYSRLDKNEDYTKEVYFPLEYETSKENRWH